MTRFVPSQYSEMSGPKEAAAGTTAALTAGATGMKIGTALVGGGAAAAGAGAAGAASASGGLLAAAGASATVPVAGWVVGGVLAATAGTIAIVGGIRKRKVSKKKAIRWAKKLGLPDPKSIPGFVLRLSKKPKSWRMRKLKRYKTLLKRIKKRQKKWRKRPGARRTVQVLTLGIQRGPERLKKQRKRVESKIALIEALNASYVRRAQRRRQTREEEARLAALQAQQAAQTPPEPEKILGMSPTVAYSLGALAIVGATGAVVLLRKKPQRRPKGKKR
jgi:hypothetical protein